MNTFKSFGVLALVALAVALGSCAHKQARVEGNYVYEHGWNYDISEGHIDVHETGTMDSKTGIYFKVTTSRESDGTIKVTDRTGNSCTTNPSLTNFIARDYITNDPSGSKAVVETKILSSSSAVIHGLNGVLNYKELTGGRYDSDWKTLAKARAYLKKYQLAK